MYLASSNAGIDFGARKQVFFQKWISNIQNACMILKYRMVFEEIPWLMASTSETARPYGLAALEVADLKTQSITVWFSGIGL